MTNTPVEWYAEKSIILTDNLQSGRITFKEWFKEQAIVLKEAKEMEKQQIEDAFDKGNPARFVDKDGEQYYNETYKKDKL
jgi:hypothetical protein